MLLGPFTVRLREIIMKSEQKICIQLKRDTLHRKFEKYVLLCKRNTIVNIFRGLGESNKDSHKRCSHTEMKEKKTSGNIHSKNVQR